MEDDTVDILEPQHRNSGHKGGVFLNRGKIESHNYDNTFRHHDIYLGATVSIYSHRFIINDADEYTLRYMEENSHQWIYSALSTIAVKLKSREQILSRSILTVPGLPVKEVTCDEIDALLQKAGLVVMKQEVKTLFRALNPTKEPTVKLTKILKFIIDQNSREQK